MGKKSEKKKLEKAEKKLKKAAKKAAKEQRKSVSAQSSVTSHERAEMIATAAYYIAEHHGFTPGRSEVDWQAAEQEIDRLLKGEKKRRQTKS